MYIVLCKKPEKNDGNNVLWREQIKICIKDEDVLIDYHFYRISPFCIDGYKNENEMEENLNKRGWNTGMSGKTYKDQFKPEELIYCLAYRKVYEKIYMSNVSDHYSNILLKIEAFLNLVDEEVLKIKCLYELEYPNIVSAKDVVRVLAKEGFIIVDSG